MKFILKDYQSDAVGKVLENLTDASDLFHRRNRRSAFSLTATTGAGKTVMAAAVIEALFNGDDAFDFEADPTAVVLWFSDDPSLNVQTLHRISQAADRIHAARLVVIENDFGEESFSPGRVYFINTSKFSRNSLLVRGHVEDETQPALPSTDLRRFTIWDTIRNTIERDDRTLYLILDEAHRGLGGTTKAGATERNTIVSRLINGHAGIPPVPIVWGISATIRRFTQAMANATDRITLSSVRVDPSRVQASGLLKDDILLDIPDETGTFDTVLLRRATRKIIACSAAWKAYATEQKSEPVVPLLVFQVPNTPDPKEMANALQTIQAEWPELTGDAFAHVFGDHTTQTFGGFQVQYIAPQRVQDARHIRVLLAKDAISTGWDCPRAEVMVSFRPARDETHITQLLGRMVRTPLARRIPGNDRLNAVECLLPFFDRTTVRSVIMSLMESSENATDDSETGGGEGRRVLIDSRDMHPNPDIPETVWSAFESLPTQSQPKRGLKPVKRLTALAHALAKDGLLPDAGKLAHRELHLVLDALQKRYPDEYNAAVSQVLSVTGRTIQVGIDDDSIATTFFTEQADNRVIDEAYRAGTRVLSPDVARSYVSHLAPPDDTTQDDGLRSAYITVAALGQMPDISTELDRAALAIADRWFSAYRVAIKGLSDDDQETYNDLLSQSTEPRQLNLTRPHVRTAETKDADGNAVPTRPKHLLCDTDGSFPIGDFNSWERGVLDSELAQKGTVAWYRNPSRSSQDSLAIAYLDGKQAWKVLRPDFLFFSQVSDGSIRASIVDPHGTHLSDAIPKLRGLAAFAKAFGDRFLRIEAIAQVKGSLRVLDVTNDTVRQAIAAASDAEALFESNHAKAY